MTDPYKILGVSSDASDDEVKRAYKALAKKYHPDLNPGDKNAEARMKQVNAAYDEIVAIRSGKQTYQQQQQSGNGTNPYGGYYYSPYQGDQRQNYGNPYSGYGRTYRTYRSDDGSTWYTYTTGPSQQNTQRRGRVVLFPGLKIFFVILMLQMLLSLLLRACTFFGMNRYYYPQPKQSKTAQVQLFDYDKEASDIG